MQSGGCLKPPLSQNVHVLTKTHLPITCIDFRIKTWHYFAEKDYNVLQKEKKQVEIEYTNNLKKSIRKPATRTKRLNEKHIPLLNLDTET